MPPRLPPPRCEHCQGVAPLRYCDWADTWWCIDRVACQERVQERVADHMLGELPDDDGPAWCGTGEADAREEAAEHRFDETKNGDWE